jgi:hypothetical protein
MNCPKGTGNRTELAAHAGFLINDYAAVVTVLDGIDGADLGTGSTYTVMAGNTGRHLACFDQMKPRLVLFAHLGVCIAARKETSPTPDTGIGINSYELTHFSPHSSLTR